LRKIPNFNMESRLLYDVSRKSLESKNKKNSLPSVKRKH
jgi:hypothetical protein